MTTLDEYLADPELQEAAWDLRPLVDGDETEGVERRVHEALERTDRFAASYGGRVAQLDSAGLREAMQELAEIQDTFGGAFSYAMLRFATDTAEPERGALLQRLQEKATEVGTKLLFCELEWAALEDEQAERLLAGEGLEFCDHYLRTVRRYRTHLLSEPEERILAEKSIPSHAAWGRLFGELTSALRVRLDGEEVSLEIALSRLQDGDRDVRRDAFEGLTTALEPGLRTRSFIYNTLIYEKSVEDRLRHYPHWLSARNLANEVSDESVMALIEAVRHRFDIPQRWYRLKAGLLGLDRIAVYDRSAPVVEEDSMVKYGSARDLVLDTYAQFSPEAGAIVRRFFTERWIDAPLRPNKRGGAFCSSTVPSVHPYVMLNYTARRRDVLVMAHELGHGLHGALAQRQGVFHQSTPLTMAETASVFGETLVFERLVAEAENDDQRLGLLTERIDGAVATVFRQMAMNRFEHLAHTSRREEGELSPERLGQLWTASQADLFGDSVEMTDGYASWWSYIPHFITTPGYVYAYAYGQLLALSAYQRFAEEGESFVPRYLELLAAGGSRSPEELGAIVGIDLTDPGFWDSGLSLVESQLARAEELVERRSAG
ncbi:MAG TPA: M3 family oligoendopeptidase [Solirubrobacteraceae bacterium]|nr:M3 family oligoendopeptidase [Solirubrobacteraceae bacterium]